MAPGICCQKIPFRDFRRQMWDLGIVVKHNDPNPIDTAAQEFLKTERWMLLKTFTALGSMQLVRDAIYAGYGDEKGLAMALGTAARLGRRDLVEFLIHKGADDFNWGLKEAAAGGHLELVKHFLSLGANDYATAVSHAIWNGHVAVAIYLLEVGTFDSLYPFLSDAIGEGNFVLANLIADKMRYLGGKNAAALAEQNLKRRLDSFRPKLVAAGLQDEVVRLDELRSKLSSPGLGRILLSKISIIQPGESVYIDMDTAQHHITLNS